MANSGQTLWPLHKALVVSDAFCHPVLAVFLGERPFLTLVSPKA